MIKTDINGIELWAKSYGFPSRQVQFLSISASQNQGTVLAGCTNKQNIYCTDPFIVKVNECGEKEWCHVYAAYDCNSGCLDIISLADGNFIALFNYWKIGSEEIIWLMKLDATGEIIWQQNYATNPAYRDENPHSLLLTNDSTILITSDTYYADSLFPGYQVLKILLIKTDLEGNVIFETPWGDNKGVISDARSTIEGNAHALYTAGRRAREGANPGDSPCLYKTSGTGQSVYYHDILDSTLAGGACAITSFADGTLAFASQWWYSTGADSTGIFKTDTLGNILKRKFITDETWSNFFSSCRTFNDRQVFSGVINNKAVAIKLNQNLDWDSVYTTPYTYDSLCPHPITTDTVPLDDCTLVTAVFDPVREAEKTAMKAWPNPASEQVTLSIPQYLVRESSRPGVIVSTVYYQWNDAALQVYDLAGTMVYSQKVDRSANELRLDTRRWKEGLYLARLVFRNETVARVKFLVGR